MFNWSLSQAAINKVLGTIGFQVTLTKLDGSTARASAVWDSNSKNGIAQGAATITGNQKQLYIAGSIKKAPVPGDYIQQGADTWQIQEVEAYKPTTTVLAYRVVVQ